jgi:VWFA-related protein
MRRHQSWAVCLFVIVIGVAGEAYAADGAARSAASADPAAGGGEYTIRAEAREVRLAFAVTDRHGELVRSLSASDVAVADNGWIIRRFRSFRRADESPLDLVVLLDASDSVAGQIPQEIAAVKKLAESVNWGRRDRLSILSFGGVHPQLICVRNCAEAAAVKLGSVGASGATPLYDALVLGLELLRRGDERGDEVEARAAMILFSDGMDTISIRAFPDVMQAAQEQQTAIYCFNTRSPKRAAGRGDAVLNALASATGGLSFAPGLQSDEALRTVLNDLRSGYVLTYDLPEERSGRHSVQILPTANPQLHFRSRLAYDDHSPAQ